MEKAPYAYQLSIEIPGKGKDKEKDQPKSVSESDTSSLAKFDKCSLNSRPVQVLLICVVIASLTFSCVSFYLLAYHYSHQLGKEQPTTVSFVCPYGHGGAEPDGTTMVTTTSTDLPSTSTSADDYPVNILTPHVTVTDYTDSDSSKSRQSLVLSTDKVNWFDALQECKSRGMELLSIATERKQNVVSTMLNSVAPNQGQDVWTSGTNLYSADTSVFYWASTGQRMNFTFWHAGTPNMPEEQHCVELTREIDAPTQGQLRWNDYGCHIKSRYICETPDSALKN